MCFLAGVSRASTFPAINVCQKMKNLIFALLIFSDFVTQYLANTRSAGSRQIYHFSSKGDRFRTMFGKYCLRIEEKN